MYEYLSKDEILEEIGFATIDYCEGGSCFNSEQEYIDFIEPYAKMHEQQKSNFDFKEMKLTNYVVNTEERKVCLVFDATRRDNVQVLDGFVFSFLDDLDELDEYKNFSDNILERDKDIFEALSG